MQELFLTQSGRAIGVALAALTAIMLTAACAQVPPELREPISLQILRVDPALKERSFRVLVDFETDSDLAAAACRAAAIERGRSHTGRQSLRVTAGTPTLTVDLSSLPGMQQFPGSWTRAGAYFYCERPCGVTVQYESQGCVLCRGRTVLEPGMWTAALVDVSGLADPNRPPPPVGKLVFDFDRDGPAVWCDDVIVVESEP